MKRLLFSILIIVCYAMPLYSWPGPTGGTSGPGWDDNTSKVDVPVDGGIITVTALAIGYGVRQARKKKDDSNTDNGAV